MKRTILYTFFISALFDFAYGQSVNPVLWTKKNGPTGGEVKEIEYDPTSGRSFVIVGQNRDLYMSANDGDTWTKLSDNNGSFNYLNDIEVAGTSIYGVTSFDVWQSTDGGANWNQISTSVSSFGNANKIIKLSTGRLVVLGNSGVFTSTNNGGAWVAGSTLTGFVNSNYLVKSAADQIYILKDNKVFRSNDFGSNFLEFSNGLPVGIQVHSLWASNSGNIFCVTADNIYTSDGSSNWTSIEGGTITDVTISSNTNPSIIEFSADDLGMFFIDNVNHKLHAKTVSGLPSTWALRQSSFPTSTSTVSTAASKSFATASTSVVLFGTQTGVIKTTNGATTYADANTSIASLEADNLLFDFSSGGNGNLIMLTNNRSTLMKSTDGGNTWSKISGIPSYINSFTQNTNRNVLYVATNTGAYRSFDGGTNWTAVTLPGGVSLNAFIPLDNDKVFGLSGNSFYYSTNQAGSWGASPQTISGFPASFSISSSSIVAASATRVILELFDFNTSTSKLYKITISYSGSTITSAAASEITNAGLSADQVNDLYGANGNYYLYSRNTNPDQLVVSTNNGSSWTTYSLANAESLFVTHNGYIFVPSYSPNRILVSRDNGATFQETTIARDRLWQIEDVAIGYDGKAHLAFDNDFLYSSTKNIVLPDALPANLTQVGRSATAVALRWDDNATNETDFEILQSTNGVDFVKSGEANDYCNTPNDRDFFVATGLTPNTNYTFQVRAVNEAGSTTTVQTTVTTLASCSQSIPDNRSWSAVNTGTSGFAIVTPKTVNIRHVGGGKYQISDISLGTLTGSPFFSSSDAATFFESCGETFVLSSNDEDIKPDGNGTWNGTNALTLKWRACSGDEYETINLTLNSTDPAPSIPTSVNAYNLTSTSIEVNWQSGSYDKTYVVERSTSPSSGFVAIATVNYPTKKHIDNSGLTLGTTYYYRVKARNGNTPTPLESSYSATASIAFSTPKFIVPSNAVTDYVAATVGAYWADFDNDGYDDYFTLSFDPVTEKGTPVFFKNSGTGNFTMTVPDGISGEAYFFATAADYDNDGKQDIAFAGNEDQVLDVYKGNGDFTFSKVTTALGDLNTVISENIDIETISWGDINNDGLLDMLVAGEIPNTSINGVFVYKQNIDHTFTKTNAGDLSTNTDATSGIAWADYDNDGFTDVLLVNTNGAFGLFKNDGQGIFTKVTGIGLNAANSFTAVWGDYNNDGHMDLYVGTFTQNALYKSNGNGTFSVDGPTSISEASQNISATWGDFNNDGYLDLLTGAFGTTSTTRLFLRDVTAPSSTVFTKIVNEKINDLSVSHYGVSAADYDNNGSLDVAMSSFSFGANNDEIGLVNTNLFKNNVATGNWCEVKLAPTSGNKSGIGATIKLTSGGVTQMRQIQASTTFVSKGGTAAHFGIGSNSTISNIQVKWANGEVQNYPNPPINQLLTIDQDLVAPSPTTFSPANNSVNIAANTTISITLDQPSTAVAGKFLMVYLNSNLASPVFGIDVATGVQNGNQFTFTLPQQLAAGTKYNVGVDAGAFIDKYGNGSGEMGSGLWTFTTATPPDVTAPTITFTPPATAAKGFGTLSPEITVTDDRGTVSSVVISIKKLTGASTTFVDVAATQGTGANSNKWVFNISEATHFDAIGTEYFITAKDPANNIARSPAGTATHRALLTYSANESKIPSDRLGFGGSVSNWKVFAIPFDLGVNNSITSVFNELNEKENKVDYRFLTIQPAGSSAWAEYPESFSSITRGQGYFSNIKTAVDVLIGPMQAPDNSRSNLFTINLKAGWNMVGNPYLTQISWANVKDYNALTGQMAELHKFNGSTYPVAVQTLEPFEGGFVFAQADKTVTIPFINQVASGGRMKHEMLTDNINEREWLLPLNVKQGTVINDLGSIGMAPDAKISLDDYDGVTPPRFIEYLETSFAHPEHFAKRFSRDVVPTQNEYTWDFEVSSSVEGSTEIFWNNSNLSNGTKELFLLDIQAQRLVDMRSVSRYTFNAKESNKFRIFFGENLRIAPVSIVLGKAFPNPTNGVTNIGFSLPDSGGQNQMVTLEILDATGRQVGTIAQGRYQPGFHETDFNANGLNSGLYTYRLTVQNARGRNVIANKLIIK